FFQEEDGIRDRNVTGVQTCALPIYAIRYRQRYRAGLYSPSSLVVRGAFNRKILRGDRVTAPMEVTVAHNGAAATVVVAGELDLRSEERRVGKGGGWRRARERGNGRG